MDIVIRPYKEEDRDVLANIFYQIRRDEFPWVDKDLLSLDDFSISTEGEAIFVSLIDGNIAGFISIWERDKFIHNLFVSKCYRKSGIGKALVDYSISRYGVPQRLKCVAENQRALEFYESHGWKIDSEGISSEGKYYLMVFS